VRKIKTTERKFRGLTRYLFWGVLSYGLVQIFNVHAFILIILVPVAELIIYFYDKKQFETFADADYYWDFREYLIRIFVLYSIVPTFYHIFTTPIHYSMPPFYSNMTSLFPLIGTLIFILSFAPAEYKLKYSRARVKNPQSKRIMICKIFYALTLLNLISWLIGF